MEEKEELILLKSEVKNIKSDIEEIKKDVKVINVREVNKNEKV